MIDNWSQTLLWEQHPSSAALVTHLYAHCSQMHTCTQTDTQTMLTLFPPPHAHTYTLVSCSRTSPFPHLNTSFFAQLHTHTTHPSLPLPLLSLGTAPGMKGKRLWATMNTLLRTGSLAYRHESVIVSAL
jgi:hypothetical protein